MSAGKQRHVGRFDDDVTAAKAYDKAAVYLYGSNAMYVWVGCRAAAEPAPASCLG